MTVPMWVLLAFAAWTLLTLMLGVGVYRWSRILTGRKKLTDWPADQPHGSPLYRRAVRAHANCVENLPVYGAVAVVLAQTGVSGPVVDSLALLFMGARIAQTLVHVLPEETSTAVGVRFTFFAMQILCLVWMGGLAAAAAL